LQIITLLTAKHLSGRVIYRAPPYVSVVWVLTSASLGRGVVSKEAIVEVNVLVHCVSRGLLFVLVVALYLFKFILLNLNYPRRTLEWAHCVVKYSLLLHDQSIRIVQVRIYHLLRNFRYNSPSISGRCFKYLLLLMYKRAFIA
jgi:hypothetical protein